MILLPVNSDHAFMDDDENMDSSSVCNETYPEDENHGVRGVEVYIDERSPSEDEQAALIAMQGMYLVFFITLQLIHSL